MGAAVKALDCADFWNGDHPKCDRLVQKAIREESDQIIAALRGLVAEKDETKKEEKMLALVNELHGDLAIVEKMRQEAKAKAFDGHPMTLQECEWLATKLDDFARELRLWCLIAMSSKGDDLLENARVRFTDAGDWGRHYSVVRMTVTTFFVGIIFGVIGVKWDEFDPSLRVAMWYAWFAALLFLGLFTLPEIKKANDQKAFQCELPTLTKVSHNQTVSVTTKFLISIPFVLMAVLTIAFGFLMAAWGDHQPVRKSRSTHLEEKVGETK